MSEKPSKSNPEAINNSTPDLTSVNPLRVITGGVISGGFAIALYSLTASIAATFAAKPITSDNQTALQISIAVRTLVVGGCALATGVFVIASLGLLALSLQILFVRLRQKQS
ncbi:MAG: DUF3082 domain-containing protein [Limnospira sp.]